MAIPLLGEIEKLINEHGSAVILKERIELLKEQYAAIERKLNESDQQRRDLSAENLSLKAQISELQAQLQTTQPLLPRAERIDPIREQLLQALARTPDYLTTAELSRGAGISEQLALYHLEDLENADFIHGSYSAYEPPEWKLIQGGRAYLAAHGLLT